MEHIDIHCGLWSKVPSYVKLMCFVPKMETETEQEMANIGFKIVGDAVDGKPTQLFTNNVYVFDAIRVGIFKLKLTENPNVRITHYGEDKVTIMQLDKDARSSIWTKGCFDMVETLLIDLF